MRGTRVRAMVVAPIAVWCGLTLGLVTACGDTDSSTATGGSSTSGGSGSATGGSSTSGGNSGTGGGGSSATGGGSATGASGGATASEPFPTGFGKAEVFVSELTRPVRLGFKNGYLYFTEMGLNGGANSRLARRDPAGNVQTLYSGNTVAALFLDDDELFIVERGTHSVFRMKYATLTPELFVTTPATVTVGDINRLGDTMWLTLFGNGTTLTSAIVGQPRTGGSTQELLPTTMRSFIFTYLQVAAGQIYVASQGTGSGLFKGSATVAPVMSVPGIVVNRLAADASFVYFGSQDDGRILRQAHGVTKSPELVADGQNTPFAVAVDGGGIYWTNGPDCDQGGPITNAGSVMGRAHQGGTPVVVANAEQCPQAMTTDADFVYWIRENPNDAVGDDVIMRAKKLR